MALFGLHFHNTLVCSLRWPWWHRSVILPLGRQKQEEREVKAYLGYIVNSKASLGYMADSYLKNKAKEKA